MSYEEKKTKKHNENFANPIEYPSQFPPSSGTKSPSFASGNNNQQSFGRNQKESSPNSKLDLKQPTRTKSPELSQDQRFKGRNDNSPSALNQSTEEIDQTPDKDEEIPSYYKNNKHDNVDKKTKALLQEARQPLASEQQPPREQQIDKLVMQNLNLREQLREMATLLDDIIEKEKEQKVMNYSQNSRPFESEQIKQRRKELQKQTDLISSNRILIQQKKRQLEYNFDINRIYEKENEVKRLRKELESVNNEKTGLKKISDEQKRAKSDIERQEFKEQVRRYLFFLAQESNIIDNLLMIFPNYNQKLDSIRKQFNEAKEENQRLGEELRGKEKELKQYIEELKTRTEKIRNINSKVKEQQSKKKTAPSSKATSSTNHIDGEEVSEENLQIIEERVIGLEKEKQELERSFIDKMKNLERERKQQQSEIERKQLVLKEREKTLKLTQMKIKEITRFIKTTAAENEKKQQQAALAAKQEQQTYQQQYLQLQQQQQMYPVQMQDDIPLQRQMAYQKAGRNNAAPLGRISQNR